MLQVGDNGRLYQTYLGERLLNDNDIQNFSWDIHAGSDGSVSQRGWEVYSGSGNEDYFEPAISITHNDGKTSTYLYYVSSSTSAVEGGTQTTINLRDDQYPVDVTLHYVAYPKENVIKTWSEIRHQEKKPIVLSAYASTMLYFNNSSYYLTEFSSDWAKEAQMSSQQLQFGKKVIDTKLGSRAAMHTHPFFELGLEQPVAEQQGKVLMGTLGWTGNFRFTFEMDNVGNLRVIPGINPYASNYASGITSMLAFHLLVNVGMTMGVMPVTGIPLPLMSYGVSSLLTNVTCLGLLMNIHMKQQSLHF